ncbi:MAG: hypothetical protein HQL07_19275, partial [Nitrospirae bacterium]|nr:hypothetical protein [Magnetococcales bacterium]
YRRLDLSFGSVCIKDQLVFKTPFRSDHIHFLEARDHGVVKKRAIGQDLVNLPQWLERLDLEKVYVLEGTWRLAELRLVGAVAREK